MIDDMRHELVSQFSEPSHVFYNLFNIWQSHAVRQYAPNESLSFLHLCPTFMWGQCTLPSPDMWGQGTLPSQGESLRPGSTLTVTVKVTLSNHLLNLFPLIPACTARPGLPLSPPETAFLESPYYRPQTASIADRHHPTNFHSVTYTQTDDAAFEAGSDNDHKSFLRMRVIFKVEYPAELFRFRRVLDDILSSFDMF